MAAWLQLAAGDGPQTPEAKAELERKIAAVRQWNYLAHKLREERQALIAEAVKMTSGNWDQVFHQVAEYDKNVEVMHPRYARQCLLLPPLLFHHHCSNPRRALRKTWSSYF